jgi:DNA-binding transcriptional MerR regulator
MLSHSPMGNDMTKGELLAYYLNPLIRVKDAGILLGVCQATIRRWAEKGKLPCERSPGGQRMFRLLDILDIAGVSVKDAVNYLEEVHRPSDGEYREFLENEVHRSTVESTRSS